jgi:hypothetical protein
VLDPDSPLEDWMPRVGDVAGGEHICNRGAQVLVHDDAVVDLEPRRLRELDPRRHAHPDHGEVALDRLAGSGAHAPDRGVALE